MKKRLEKKTWRMAEIQKKKKNPRKKEKKSIGKKKFQ